ncbi:MAG: hypothetical protein Q6363_008200 [Candidatus Njordarchaeota archaeon]
MHEIIQKYVKHLDHIIEELEKSKREFSKTISEDDSIKAREVLRKIIDLLLNSIDFAALLYRSLVILYVGDEDE